MAIHAMAWASLAEFGAGNWGRITGELLPRVQTRLGDRKDDPPYFVMHTYGAAAFVHDATGDPEADRNLALLERLASHEGRTFTLLDWLAWILARRGRLDEARAHVEEVTVLPTDVSRPFDAQIRASVLAEAERWAEAASFLPGTREYAAEAGLRALPVHLDRLEGRIALASGHPDRSIQLLEGASEAFGGLPAPWEQACTDLLLAEAFLAVNDPERARARVGDAAPVFDRLRSLREIHRTSDLRRRLG
jgi:hypothetical protein